jgi:DNA replication protein DnaC
LRKTKTNEEKMLEEIINHLEAKAKEFGAKNVDEYSKDYILRRNIKKDAFENHRAFFGFIHPEEETSGPYHDFSFVVFPSNPDDDSARHWVVCLGIGSLGFKNDFELATFPGLRRLFNSIIDNEKSFCKTDFSDIETALPKSFLQNQEIVTLEKTLAKYKKVLPVCQIIEKPELNNEDIIENKSFQILEGFLAAYAKLRNWPSNNTQRKSVSEAIEKIKSKMTTISDKEIEKILSNRKYIILEGAPGTGKTRMAQLLAQKINAKIFFTQFHAETTYSDFIWGLRPKLNSSEIIYEETKGPFVKALENSLNELNKAKEENRTPQKTILIVDEINRANLSNILGPIFYLFEYQRINSNTKIDITPNLKIDTLPENFYVIATMNTADRSLAVVDFALRRRFAWITLKSEVIDNSDLNQGYTFFKEDFAKFEEIFQWYASSNELNLQPGQAYFIAKNEGEMQDRITYELFPLIKEYLEEGLLISAKEEFNSYFQARIKKSLFE